MCDKNSSAQAQMSTERLWQEGKPNQHPALAIPKAITGAISPPQPDPHNYRGTQKHKGRQKPKLRTWKMGHTAQASPDTIPAGPQPWLSVQA